MTCPSNTDVYEAQLLQTRLNAFNSIFQIYEEEEKGNNSLYFLPVRCPSTPTFDLPSLLQKSAEVEEALIIEDTANDALENGPFESVASPSYPSGCRPPGMDYGHWLRQMKSEARYRAEGHKPRPKTLKALVPQAVKGVEQTQLDCFTLPATNGAYGARISKADVQEKVYSLEEVKELGIRVLEWNGRVPVPLLDKDGRIFAVLAGRPGADDYTDACNAVYKLLETEGKHAPFTADQLHHRRGEYPALNIGVTHGNGTLRPTFLDTHPHTELVERLLKDASVQFQATLPCFFKFAHIFRPFSSLYSILPANR